MKLQTFALLAITLARHGYIHASMNLKKNRTTANESMATMQDRHLEVCACLQTGSLFPSPTY